MVKKAAKVRVRKHHHGTPNLIIQAEEVSILATVDKALASSTNTQIVGANGEIPLKLFFNRYLPITLRAASGHFLTPSGKISPQLDIMILDSRYPLLSENSDGSVLAMLHSVVGTIECKTRITTTDIKKLWANASTINTLASEVEGYAGTAWGSLSQFVFAYRSRQRLNTLADRYFGLGTPDKGFVEFLLLRLPDQDQNRLEKLGAFFHFELDSIQKKKGKINKYIPMLLRLHTPLSDLYYMVVQGAYYALGDRDFSFNDIIKHVRDYLSWSTCRSDK